MLLWVAAAAIGILVTFILKKSELRKLVSDYSLLKIKSKKHNVTDKLKQIEHRYFHETGRNIIDDMS